MSDPDPEAQCLRPTNGIERPTVVRSTTAKQPAKWKSILEQRIYILTWMKTYDKETALSDAIAGITLGLTMIPQAIAYAALAGLPSQYGLYSAFIGSLTYVFFGTIRQVSIGPTALMSLMTLQYTMDHPPEFAAVLAFLAGCIELLMGVLNLGFIVTFISIPVTNAFTSATSLIVVGAQLKNLVGVKYSSKGFADSIYELLARIGDCQMADGILGLICCIFLFAFKQLTAIPVNTETKKGQLIKKSLWYVSIARNAIVVVCTSFIAFKWADGNPPFKLSGKVVPGVPQFQLPPFEIEYKNHTAGFVEICSELGSGILVVPIVAVLANIAIAKAFASGSTIDAKQEMLALGLCNLLGSCFKSMPTCGAFSRCAVSQASGVKTPMAGMYAGLMTILALSVLTPYFYFIPKAALASVLIVAVIFLVDIDMPVYLWHKNRRDFWAWLGTLIVCLAIGVELGLLFGIIMNVIHLLYLWARPNVTVAHNDVDGVEYVYMEPQIGLFFPSIDYLREFITKVSTEIDYKKPIVLDCGKFTDLDYTAAQGINLIATDLKNQNQYLILLNLKDSSSQFISKDILKCNVDVSLESVLKPHFEIDESQTINEKSKENND